MHMCTYQPVESSQASLLDRHSKKSVNPSLHIIDTSGWLTHVLKSSTATFSSFSPLVQPTWTQEWQVGQLLSLQQVST